MADLITTLGAIHEQDTGLILPHEHIFVDLRPLDQQDYQSIPPGQVKRVMLPYLEQLKGAGGTVLVECTPAGIGRRADIDKSVSLAAEFPVVMPTGIYREPWVPDWAKEASVEFLRDWMMAELTCEIDDTGVQAGWIKLSAGDDGLTDNETKILRAAAQSGKYSGALIGSHTIRGGVVQDQLRIIEEEGYSPERFVWIHTQAEPDAALHLEMARRGVWIEFDDIGSAEDQVVIERILRVLEAGLEDHLLLSQDRGVYDAAAVDGGEIRPYTYLPETFLPKLSAAGVDDETIRKLTQSNPFKAFAR
jgi:phosphotriesterase-related protein